MNRMSRHGICEPQQGQATTNDPQSTSTLGNILLSIRRTAVFRTSPSQYRLASSRSLPSRYTNQEEHAPAGVREIASPRDPIKQHDRKRPPKPNFIVGRTLSGKLNIDGYVLQITHVGRKTRVRSAFMNRTVQNKPSVFGLEPLNKRKAEHLIAHLSCKYDSDWDATFHAVEHFTVVILVSKTNGTRRLNRVLNDPRTIVQIERRHIVDALGLPLARLYPATPLPCILM